MGRFSTHMQDNEIWCPECGGDGHGIAFAGPGVEWGYGFIPREVEVQCERCEGSGTVEAEQGGET